MKHRRAFAAFAAAASVALATPALAQAPTGTTPGAPTRGSSSPAAPTTASPPGSATSTTRKPTTTTTAGPTTTRVPTAPAISAARKAAPGPSALRRDALTDASAVRLGYGFDLFAVVGDDLAGRRETEAATVAALEEAAADLHLRQNQRQAALERIAVLSSNLIGAKRDQQRHAGALVDVLQGSLIDVSEGMQMLWLEPQQATRQLYSNSLYDSAAAHVRGLLAKDAVMIATLEVQLLQARSSLKMVEQALGKATERFASTVETLEEARTVVADAERVVAELVANRRYRNLDIDLLPLDAYVRAARLAALREPQCGIEWWMLAAVGMVESGHARGREVLRNGDVVDQIVGPVLDGNDDTQEIKDTDAGLLDGDTEFDRAVGPMQFTPETWKIRSADGNGDGVRNVNNLYDASFAAALMLCNMREGDRLSTATGFGTAVFAYNNSDRYVSRVLANAVDYQRSDLWPTNVVNLVVGGAAPTKPLIDALSAAGLNPQIVAAGDANRIAATLYLADEYDFRAVAGPLLVIADAGWSAADQRRVAAAVKAGALGLPVLWLGPGAPDGVPSLVADVPSCRDCEAASSFANSLRPAIEAVRVRAERDSVSTQRR